MTVFVELLTALAVWVATTALGQFGADVRPEQPRKPTVERTIHVEPRQAADTCPQASAAKVRAA